ncbi:MAG: arsenic resistance N-acetyltransferase ArsN2 [Mucilaginibacter sp.]
MEIRDAINYKESIIAMLEAEKLPVDDLPAGLDNFRVALANNEVIGVAGLEVYGNYGLLRSIAVKPAFRSQGVAGKLLREIESTAVNKGLTALYLLTETAPDYFRQKDYELIGRADVPTEVQQSSEFSYACPQSAIIMKKNL